MRRGVVVTLLVLIILCLPGCAAQRATELAEVSDELRELLHLHTYEHRYRDVVYFGEEKSFLFFKTVDRAVLFAVDITVRAGLDLSDGITLTRDRTSRNRIYVQMPAARILTVDVDESSIHQYFIREQGGAIGLLEISEHMEEVKERTSEDAEERGILDRADQNARQIIQGFLEMAGFTEVVFAPAQPAPEFQG